MKIAFINFPHVFTDTGERILISDCIQQPKVGDRLERDDDLQLYKVYHVGDSAECASGLCEIKLEG